MRVRRALHELRPRTSGPLSSPSVLSLACRRGIAGRRASRTDNAARARLQEAASADAGRAARCRAVCNRSHAVCQWQLRKKPCKQMAIKETKNTYVTVVVIKGSQITN
jgi:hypothetical protein